jgi:hypothetical protein
VVVVTCMYTCSERANCNQPQCHVIAFFRFVPWGGWRGDNLHWPAMSSSLLDCCDLHLRRFDT